MQSECGYWAGLRVQLEIVPQIEDVGLSRIEGFRVVSACAEKDIRMGEGNTCQQTGQD